MSFYDLLRRWEQRIGALSMPSPLAWVLLAGAFLGFGVLVGRVTGSEYSIGALAAKRAPLELLVASAPGSTTAGTTTAAKPPPIAEAEATPERSATSTSSSKDAKRAAAGGASSSSSGSSRSIEEPFSGGGGSSSQGSKSKLSSIKHVFVVMLSEEPYATAFGPASPAHYLTGTLEKRGELLVRYYGVAHEGLANRVALLSGQGPTEATAANCPTYSDVSVTGTGPDGQVLGQGCVYPASTDTLAGQLAAKHLRWKAYVEGIDEGPGTPPACAHPVTGASDNDPSVALTPGTEYQTWRNPFVYFHSILASPKCVADDVGMRELKGDLASERRTASFSYIAPGPCDDGSPTPCAPGRQAGMVGADGFLKRVVPEILASKAYKHGGMLAITVDGAPSSGEFADSSSCCGQPRFANLPAPSGAAALSAQGGGQVGLLLLSPFVKGGKLVQDTYNHFSLLASVEQIFGLPRLGYAGLSEVKPFSASLFSGG